MPTIDAIEIRHYALPLDPPFHAGLGPNTAHVPRHHTGARARWGL